MTSNPALIRAASVALLVVLFHSPAARADPITGSIDISVATPVSDGGVPLADATYLRGGDILSHFSGDLIGADPGGPTYQGAIPVEFYPPTDFLQVGDANVGDTDTFVFVDPLDQNDIYTFIIDPLSWVTTTTVTGLDTGTGL